jgi:hypothetical protein
MSGQDEDGDAVMNAVAERPTTVAPTSEMAPQTGDAARDLALGFLRYASACWRGETAAAAFTAVLASYWRHSMPPAPASPPDAVSPHGGGGRGICWYQRADVVLGYVPGARGGYVVPAAAVARLLRCVPTTPCARLDTLASRHVLTTAHVSPVWHRWDEDLARYGAGLVNYI